MRVYCNFELVPNNGANMLDCTVNNWKEYMEFVKRSTLLQLYFANSTLLPIVRVWSRQFLEMEHARDLPRPPYSCTVGL